MIRVTSTALNAGPLAGGCIASVRNQTHEDWTHHFIDAKSDDDTLDYATRAAGCDSRVHLWRNKERTDIFDNLLPIWRSFHDEDIIVWLDGDDRLAHDGALETVLRAHAGGALVTYGQFVWPDGTLGTAAQVGYNPRKETWRATHLKTWRAGLLKHLRDSDLRDPETGRYSNLVTDMPIMFALLELVGERAVFIPEVLHRYSGARHMRAHPEDQELELERVRWIRALPSYTPLFPRGEPAFRPERADGPAISPTGFWRGADAHKHHSCSAPLARWIAEYLSHRKGQRLYDIGCGTGTYLRILGDHGFTNLVGYEGDPPAYPEVGWIRKHDLTTPLTVTPGNVVCLEVAEHIPPQFEDTFLENLADACEDGANLILSWAVRGQGGDGHVNCRDNHEVMEIMGERGFKLLAEETSAARGVITELPWFRDTLFVFRKVPTRRGREIPKILHQIWIGPKPAPERLMQTWLERHTEWTYKLWTNETATAGWENHRAIDAMPEWNGKADIMRYEILEREGGVLVNADSRCLQPLSDEMLEHEAFACWEHEYERAGLIAAGYVGAVQGSALMRECINTIAAMPIELLSGGAHRAWETVGPGLLTRASRGHPLRVYPARTFIPKHFSGALAPGSYPVYADQLWGSTLGYDAIAEAP